jgi:hypothetical protein
MFIVIFCTLWRGFHAQGKLRTWKRVHREIRNAEEMRRWLSHECHILFTCRTRFSWHTPMFIEVLYTLWQHFLRISAVQLP